MNKIDEKFVFSERCEELRRGVASRSNLRNIRRGKFTRHDDDGKTPFEDIFDKYPNEPYHVCLAMAIVESWMVTEPTIFPREILLGFPRPDRNTQEHFSWGICCDTEPEDYDDRLRRIAPKMLPVTNEYMHEEGRRLMGKEAYEAARSCGLWGTGGYQGHTVPGFDKLLRVGVGGILAEIDLYDGKTPDTDTEKKSFYQALCILMEGFSRWILMYADYADEMAANAENERDAAELHAAAENARRIAVDKPVDMYGAAQLTWFYALWDTVDSMGRVDQYLMPFYKGSKDDDYVCALMMKFWELGVHCVTVGGVKPDGTDGTNALSYLLLQILRSLRDVHPRMSVRVHDGMEPELLELAVKMWSEGMGDPTLVSDDNVIGGLTRVGAKLEDARDYTVLGCQEVEIPGKSNFGCEDGSINLVKVLELTLNHGRDRFSGVQITPDFGEIADYKTFDELWDAFEKTVKYLVEIFVILCNKGVDIRVMNSSKIVKACTTEACIERGLDHDNGGTVYNYGVVETGGSAAVGDALYAMKTLVYDEGKITLEELSAAIAANFEGYKHIQKLLREAPKFGNDHDGVDEMTVRVLNMFWDEIAKYKSARGDVFTGACALLESGISYGDRSWALPDGNEKCRPIGNTVGPRTGSAKNGLTAMLKSVAKLPLEKAFGGAACNVLIPRDMMESEESRKKIADLMRTYLKMGGQMAQVTTAPLSEMRDAQLHPELHEDLIARVGGYSAFFISLDGSIQNEMIARYSQYEN